MSLVRRAPLLAVLGGVACLALACGEKGTEFPPYQTGGDGGGGGSGGTGGSAGGGSGGSGGSAGSGGESTGGSGGMAGSGGEGGNAGEGGSGGTGGAGVFSLDVQGSGFTTIGTTDISAAQVVVALVDDATGIILAQQSSGITAGAFSTHLANTVAPGTTYRVAVLVDVDTTRGPGVCDPTDFFFEKAYGPASDDGSIAFAASDGQGTADECTAIFTPPPQIFDLEAKATDDLGTTGVAVQLRMIKGSENSLVASQETTLDNLGEFDVTFPQAASVGTDYNVQAWVDADGDGICESDPGNGTSEVREAAFHWATPAVAPVVIFDGVDDGHADCSFFQP